MLKLFKRTESDEGADSRLFGQKTAEFEAKIDLLQRSIPALLHFLKSFALDIEELETDKYKHILDELRTMFQEFENPKKLELHFEKRKDDILMFIERQHSYVQDRDKELRDIIDLLTKAMANSSVDNREFYRRVHDQSEKIIEISLLDDIKKLKQALKQEVEQMRAIVDLKQNQDQRQIQLLAGQVDVLQKELEKTKTKSMTDGLTGIYNRQAFDEHLAEKIERRHDMNGDFSLLLMDLDNFKAINDKYGHLIGDRVLMAFAQKCRLSTRADDFFARYGGEEFAIILNGAGLRDALNKASQICKTIASARYATCETQTNDYISMTVSIGVGPYKNGDTVETLIARADKALYEAKNKGKNMAIGRKA
jgi:diguanylate cyclase